MLWYKRCLIFLLCFAAAVLTGIWINSRMSGEAGHPLLDIRTVCGAYCPLLDIRAVREAHCPLFPAGRKGVKRMLDYMEDKYGEDFVDEEAWGGQMGKAYVMRRVHSASRPGESVLVRAMGEEEIIFQDNYLAYLLRDAIEERVKGPAEEAFGECKVFYKIPELVFPPEFPADMEADAFLQNPLSMVRIYVYVKSSPLKGQEYRQEQMDGFLDALFWEGYVIGGVVSYPAGEEMYEMITADNFAGDIYQGYQSRAEALFSMKENGEISYFRWNGCQNEGKGESGNR